MLSTTTRLSNLNAREKRFLVAGTLIALLLLAFLLWPSGEADQSSVELVPAGQRAGGGAGPVVAAPPPPVAAPLPVVTAPAAALPAPPGGAGSPEGLRLHGVTGSGAIIGYPDGSQRFVALGRDVLPGLRLQGVRVHHAMLAAATTNYRLGFNGPAAAIGPPAAPPVPNAPAVVTATPAEARRMSAERAQTAQYLQILSPRQVNGRTSGYTVRPGPGAAPLEQAGLRPGDTILSVNGTPLGAEQLQELAWTINNSTRTEFVVERGGQRLNFTYAPNR